MAWGSEATLSAVDTLSCCLYTSSPTNNIPLPPSPMLAPVFHDIIIVHAAAGCSCTAGSTCAQERQACDGISQMGEMTPSAFAQNVLL